MKRARRAGVCACAAAVLVAPLTARALPVQTGSVDLLSQAQVRLEGPAGSQAGTSVAVLPGAARGGRAAIAVGMPGAGPAGRAGAGSVAVVRGARRLPRVVDLSGLNGRNGFVVFGARAGDESGFALAAVPQRRRPPLLAIGAPQAATHGRPGAGVVYLVDPRRVHGATVDLARPSRAVVGVVAGPGRGAEAGYALAAGALSRGGGDLLIGAPAAAGRHGAYAGAAFAVFGTHRPRRVDLARPGRSAASVAGPATDAGLGSAVAIAPARAGGRRAWIGAPTASPGGRGAAGSAFGVGALRPGARLDTARGGNLTRVDGARSGDGLGGAIAVPGPLPGRGVLLALGASGASPSGRQAAGQVTLLPIRRLRRRIDLLHPSVPVRTVAGAHPFDGAGSALAPVLDPVRNTRALALGAPFADGDDAEDLGAGYVFGGRRGALPRDAGRVGSGGVTITGARRDDQAATSLGSGWALGSRRAPDLLVGAPYALTRGGETGGAVYVIAGVPSRARHRRR